MTYRDLISSIKSNSKLISSDQRLTDRAILSLIKPAASYLIRQQVEKRKLWDSPNIFTLLPCIPMKQVPIGECCNYTSPVKVARSENKLPKIGDSLFGLLIQRCTSVDNMVEFIYATPERYVNSLKLGLKTSNVFYWIQNDYLYITNEDTKSANLYAYTEEEVDLSILYPENCDCKSTPKDKCTNPLDRDAQIPGYLIQAVDDMVAKKLLQVYQNSVTDKTSDNKDDTSR